MSLQITTEMKIEQDQTARRVRGVWRVDGMKMKTLCTFNVVGKYKDFRDTMTRYYLYLPFSNTIELENAKILDKAVTVKCYIDVRTGALKYYIESNGTLIATSSGQVRLDMPCTSTNPMQRYQEIREQSRSEVESRQNFVSSSIQSLLNKNPMGIVSNAFNGELGLSNQAIHRANREALKRPLSTQFNGQYSPSTCIDDPLDIYLYTIEPNIEYDEGIKNNYGLPSNKWGVLGANSGYVEIDDIRLTGAIPQDDKAEIIATLQSGVYIV